jgi:hypothetical protein
VHSYCAVPLSSACVGNYRQCSWIPHVYIRAHAATHAALLCQRFVTHPHTCTAALLHTPRTTHATANTHNHHTTIRNVPGGGAAPVPSGPSPSAASSASAALLCSSPKHKHVQCSCIPYIYVRMRQHMQLCTANAVSPTRLHAQLLYSTQPDRHSNYNCNVPGGGAAPAPSGPSPSAASSASATLLCSSPTHKHVQCSCIPYIYVRMCNTCSSALPTLRHPPPYIHSCSAAHTPHYTRHGKHTQP